jgi:hypothetical protein
MTDVTTESVAQDTDLELLGPVDYVVVEFPAGKSNFTGEMAKELLALVHAGTIRQSCWPPKTSITSPPPWSREAPREC